jgi:hypothetical protein
MRLLLMPRAVPYTGGGQSNGLSSKHWKPLEAMDGKVSEFRKRRGSDKGKFDEIVGMTRCAIEWTRTSQKYETVLNIFCAVCEPIVRILSTC